MGLGSGNDWKRSVGWTICLKRRIGAKRLSRIVFIMVTGEVVVEKLGVREDRQSRRKRERILVCFRGQQMRTFISS